MLGNFASPGSIDWHMRKVNRLRVFPLHLIVCEWVCVRAHLIVCEWVCVRAHLIVHVIQTCIHTYVCLHKCMFVWTLASFQGSR
jgi:hypothetical protein